MVSKSVDGVDIGGVAIPESGYRIPDTGERRAVSGERKPDTGFQKLQITRRSPRINERFSSF
jgi:hypothetical protein